MGRPWRDRPDLLPSLAVGLASVIWGLYWIPLRHLEARGLEGLWPTLGVFLLAAILFVPVLAARWRHFARAGRGLLITGLVCGAAFATYSVSLLLTEVVRALLLFYVSPVWSTLLGLVLLGERLTPARVAALVLGLGGLTVILGLEQGFPMPRNAGDWLALASGALWAYGSLRIFRAPQVEVLEQAVVFVFGGLILCLAAAALPAGIVGPVPRAPMAPEIALPMIFLVLVMFLPIVYLTLFGARRLSPARVGILLMGEVVVGVSSAAILTTEPFATREALGTALVLGATAAEVLQRQQPLAARRPPHPLESR